MNEKRILVNERGCRVGQFHLKASLTDHEVELIRQLNEEGLGYQRLAEKFGVGKSTIQMICTYQRRNQVMVKEKVVYG